LRVHSGIDRPPRSPFNFMNPLIPDLLKLVLTTDSMRTPEAVVAELDSASTIEEIRARESTPIPPFDKTVQFLPYAHWGINE